MLVVLYYFLDGKQMPTEDWPLNIASCRCHVVRGLRVLEHLVKNVVNHGISRDMFCRKIIFNMTIPLEREKG